MKVRTICEDKVRLSFDVSSELDNLLDDLAKETNGSKSDVFRKAIVLMKVAVDEKKQCNKLGVIDNNGQVITELVGI